MTPTAKSGLIGVRQYVNGSSAFEVRLQAAASGLAFRGTVLGSVDGHPITRSDEGWERCANWEPEPGLLAQVCSMSKPFFDADELLAIVRSTA